MHSKAIAIFCIILHSAFAQNDKRNGTTSDGVVCKCGGSYVNGRAVAGCVDQRCTASGSAQCVTMYRKDVVVGYDCLPFPFRAGQCAMFDDGSRICANDKCQPASLGWQNDECRMETDNAHASVAVRVGDTGFRFVTESVLRHVREKLDSLKIPDQRTRQLGFDILVSGVKIDTFVLPQFVHQLLPPTSTKIVATKGDFKACAKWEAKKFGVGPSGDVCLWSENKTGVNATVSVELSVTKNGRVKIDTTSCDFKMPVDMKFTGLIGTLINVVRGWIEEAVQTQISKEFCKAVGETVRATLNALLQELPTQFKVDDRYGLEYQFRSVAISDEYLTSQFVINATFAEAPATILKKVKRSLTVI